jgi:hypothetical protein
MIVGGITTVICLLALAWVREIVGGVLGIFGAEKQSDGVKITIIVVATILMYCLDFAINTGNVPSRIFLMGALVDIALSDRYLQFRRGFALSLWTMPQLISKSPQMPGQVGSRAQGISWATS